MGDCVSAGWSCSLRLTLIGLAIGMERHAGVRVCKSGSRQKRIGGCLELGIIEVFGFVGFFGCFEWFGFSPLYLVILGWGILVLARGTETMRGM